MTRAARWPVIVVLGAAGAGCGAGGLEASEQPVVVAIPTAEAVTPEPPGAEEDGDRKRPPPRADDLVALVRKHCRGMQVEGAPLRFDLGAAEVRHPLVMQPGRCYAVVAEGADVRQLELSVVMVFPPGTAPLGLPAAILAASTGTGRTAVIGAAPNCFKNPMPLGLPVELRVVAHDGPGSATVRVCHKGVGA